jgi:hypothetical protein
MKNYYIYCVAAVIMTLPFIGISQTIFSLQEASNHLPHLYGKKENAHDLCVTAGDRLYSIGDQAGNYPAVGFHVPGEMGGIWQHPIKLLDGFRLTITDSKTKVAQQADKCDSFVTYSFTTRFLYDFPQQHVGAENFLPLHGLHLGCRINV